MDISAVKLIIWDLDDTFWDGTLSEGNVKPLKKCIDTVILAAKKGIVSSICSKNDFEPCKKQLTDFGVWDYFVFSSINWESKGQRVSRLISDMNLRPANALFIDDNRLNLEEAKYYSPELMTAEPDIIGELFDALSALDHDDSSLERLNRYKTLEKKHREKQSVGSNEEFLLQSDIRVDIRSDCLAQIERIHELILRSNQLNYTKVRASREELEATLKNPEIKSGYVTAGDKYGEYGIIGFFAYQPDHSPADTNTCGACSHGGKMIHFLFSCRTLGMGIEQYVYEKIGFPEMEIAGSVSAPVGKDYPPVTWINKKNTEKTPKKALKNIEKASKKALKSTEITLENDEKTNFKILMKGPCDLLQIFSFIKNEELFDCEFTYVSEEEHSLGATIEGINHTAQIVGAKTLNNAEKAEACALPMCDSKMYSAAIYDNDYDMVFISLLTDANLGLYKKIGGNQIIAFGEWLYPLTDKTNWDGYISGKLYTGNCKFTRDFFEKFSSEYEFIGRITPEGLAENLKFIRENIPEHTEMVIMLGCETEFANNEREAWKNRHSEHAKYNDAVRDFAANYGNIELFDVNDYVKSQDDFADSINHYKKRVYYMMAQKFIEMIAARSAKKLQKPSKLKLAYLSFKQKIKELLKR